MDIFSGHKDNQNTCHPKNKTKWQAKLSGRYAAQRPFLGARRIPERSVAIFFGIIKE
jgi:hypothetical protein